MAQFLAQFHPATTHIPIATSFLAAVAATLAVILKKDALKTSWAVLTLVALVCVLPTIVTGIYAAKGRFNDKGKPFIEHGVLVPNTPENARLVVHQRLGLTGFGLALIASVFAVRHLRRKRVHVAVMIVLAWLLSVTWAVGGHIGGRELWGPDTFPAYESSE
jgi:uncharacterized membrane protein